MISLSTFAAAYPYSTGKDGINAEDGLYAKSQEVLHWIFRESGTVRRLMSQQRFKKSYKKQVEKVWYV
jgi:hypothetical protein